MKTINEILTGNVQNISKSCQGSIEPVKSFVSKIIKKDKEFVRDNTINKYDNLFKPLQGFIKNNGDLTPDCIKVISAFVEQQVVKYYDSSYAPDILAYSNSHLIN